MLLFGVDLFKGCRLYRSTHWDDMGCGEEGIVCVMMGLLVDSSLGSLAANITLFVGRSSLGVLCVVLECCIFL